MGYAEDLVRARTKAQIDQENERYRQERLADSIAAKQAFPEIPTLAGQVVRELNRLQWPDARIDTVGTREIAMYPFGDRGHSVGSDGLVYYPGVTGFDRFNEPCLYGPVAYDNAHNYELVTIGRVIGDLRRVLTDLQSR